MSGFSPKLTGMLLKVQRPWKHPSMLFKFKDFSAIFVANSLKEVGIKLRWQHRDKNHVGTRSHWRALVDTVYGTELGFRAWLEVRAEVLELVNQLEATNPTLAPTQAPELLDGNWVLLYTAFSELLPLLAAGTTPLLKVDKITQAIDTSGLTIVNATTLSGPFATFTFSASASFEVRSPSRIQRINLSPLQQTLNPLQEAVGNISRVISGQPPLKLPIPGERTKSWLIRTYPDEDFHISRGDGGFLVLVKEGSPFLYQ
ncbi:hypothetical protein FEM48_Zijuj11G0144000 [Ziziphus jujuba var. spinosa]|uniref:Plastid lipid-associated protein/fibrillin conserved domain-containing protein n=1 Tax=Ziziphus jujuba var. spinosa TaxID=714518 RepID=A0A978UJG5_ZIZJJ|nr:hypothetical protein FEM48_Zijuj11G0144000 [Ziziphus jujuba var. spinosa]